jgi:hypothetical protein
LYQTPAAATNAVSIAVAKCHKRLSCQKSPKGTGCQLG